jgi:hypothetical protein
MGNIERTVTFKEILAAKSVEALQRNMIAREVDLLRRESYVEQFKLMENRFGIRTLRKFESWSAFIEAAQRRNVIVHCGGRVTEQYLSVCKEEGVRFEREPVVGEELLVGPKYFNQAVEILYEVGLKLSQTLWRKLLPRNLEQADVDLIDRIYSELESEKWARAAMIGAFGVDCLPCHSSDEKKRILAINYAQALKWVGRECEARAVLGRFDWSGSDERFLLAVAVLHSDYERASELMRRIGVERGPTRKDYHQWPLFREFRKTGQFTKTYLEMFGEDFTTTSQRWNEQIARELSEERNLLAKANAPERADGSGSAPL